MDSQIEEFNWNQRLFLSVLTTYRKKVNKANPVTMQLLEEILDTIGSLIETIDEVQTETKLINFAIDDTKFEFRGTIFCRLCQVSLKSSRRDYMLHSASKKHNDQLVATLNTKIGSHKNPLGDTNNNDESHITSVNSQGKEDSHEPLQNLLDQLHAKKANAVKTEAPNAEAIGKNENGEQEKAPNNGATSKNGQATERDDAMDDRAKFDAFRDAKKLTAVNRDKAISERMGFNGGTAASHVSEGNLGNSQVERKPSKPAIVVQNTIPEGAKAGKGMKDCPTYEFNAMYQKFPHLNPNKVENPLKPAERPKAAPVQQQKSHSQIMSEQIKANEMRNERRGSEPWRTDDQRNGNEWRAKNEQPRENMPRNMNDSSWRTAKQPPKVNEPRLNEPKALQPRANEPQKMNDWKQSRNLNEPRRIDDPARSSAMWHIFQSLHKEKSDVMQQLLKVYENDQSNGGRETEGVDRSNEFHRSGSSNSLVSLPAFGNANVKPGAGNRMPARSSSSMNIATPGAGDMKQKHCSPPDGPSHLRRNQQQNHGNEQNHVNNDQKRPNDKNRPNDLNRSKDQVRPNDQNRPSPNGQHQNKNQNNHSPINMNQNTAAKLPAQQITCYPPYAASKGAIPKQPQAIPSTYNRQEMSQSATNDSARVVNDSNLSKLFSGDLNSLINVMVDMNMAPSNTLKSMEIIQSIETTLKTQFSDVKCHLIGSHVYGVAMGGLATYDFYLDLLNSFTTDKSGEVFVKGINDAMKLLQQKDNWSNVHCSEQSRYATLSASYHLSPQSVCSPQMLPCKFTFGTGVGVRNTALIESLFAAQPVAQQLVICIRLALKDGAAGDWEKHFSGYVITLLVIFYLQITKKLPSVLSLQSSAHPKLIKCGENMVHFESPRKLICKDRVGDLLIGIFDYYEQFDFQNIIISPFEGREINHMFRNYNVDDLSSSMFRFKKLMENHPQRWTTNRMCVQDIFEHKRNVTQNIQTKEIKAFKEFCKRSLIAIRAARNSVKY